MKKLLIVAGVVLALFAGVVAITAFLPPSPERLPDSLTNSRPIGTRALGQVLAANGVHATQVTTLDEVATAPSGSTLAVYLSTALSDQAIDTLNRSSADLVLLYPGEFRNTDVSKLTDNQVDTRSFYSTSAAAYADCLDPAAQAAGTMTDDAYYGLRAGNDEVTICFGGASDTGLYADLRTNAHRVTVIAGDTWVQNDAITEDGNAALALGVFGRHDQLTWFLPGADAAITATPDSPDAGVDAFGLLPPWSRPVFFLLLVAGAAAALWQGRRFGALVREQMPVEVPASEASSGLARLYRQANSRGHAAAALRAATIRRAAAGVGLAPSAPPEAVITQLAQASGEDPALLRDLLYGPGPTTDANLATLAAALTELDRKLSSR